MLQTTDSDGVYKNAEDLFCDNQLAAEEPAAKALQLAAEATLTLICDQKAAGNETYYRLNDNKVCFAWLLQQWSLSEQATVDKLYGF